MMTGSQRGDKWLSSDLVRTVGPDISNKNWSVLVKYRFITAIIKAVTACRRRPGRSGAGLRGKAIGHSEFAVCL